MIGIYKIENLINGKVYIGQSVNIKERWQEHKRVIFRDNKSSKIKQRYPLYLAFSKYGIENFSFEVIEECLTEELDEKERFYIKKYNSYINFPNSNGYNLDLGGIGTRKISEETVEKIISLWEEGKATREIEQIVGANKHTIIKYLKSFSDYNQKEGDFRGRVNAGISHRKKVDCYDLWGEFLQTYDSIREASQKLKLNQSRIIECCKGKISRLNNYRFTYFQENKIIEFNGKFPKDFVVKLSNEEKYKIFPSISAAAKFLNVAIETLKSNYKKDKKCKGYKIEIKNY